MMSKKKKKNNKNIKSETVEEALARGVKIERLPSSDEVRKQRIANGELKEKKQPNVKGIQVSALNIKSLGEAADFYGKKSKRKKVVKKADFSSIDKEYIPKSLHYILERNNNSETEESQEKKENT
jgi:hypothetical protein